MQKVLCIHPEDDMLVALSDLAAGEVVNWEGESILISSAVKTKHKLARRAFRQGETGIFDLYRSAFFPDEWAGWGAVGVAAAISFGMLAVGVAVFRRLEGAVLKEI